MAATNADLLRQEIVFHYYPMPETEEPLTADEFLQSVSPRAYRDIVEKLAAQTRDPSRCLMLVASGAVVVRMQMAESDNRRGQLTFKVLFDGEKCRFLSESKRLCHQRWNKFGRQVTAEGEQRKILSAADTDLLLKATALLQSVGVLEQTPRLSSSLKTQRDGSRYNNHDDTNPTKRARHETWTIKK